MGVPSKKLNAAVEELAKLPGVGKRTALRYAFYLLKKDPKEIITFVEGISGLLSLKKCYTCNNLCEQEFCEICLNQLRDKNVICVVENVRDLYAIESTNQFKGLYHVLDGLISPMEGIGPSEINIGSLLARVQNDSVKEIILALSSTVEAETTNFYIYKKIKNENLRISNLARGIAFGDELEYSDEISLGRSLINRIDYQNETER